MTRLTWMVILAALLAAAPALALAENGGAPAPAGGGTAIGSDDPSAPAGAPSDAPADESGGQAGNPRGGEPTTQPAKPPQNMLGNWTLPIVIIGVLALMFVMSSRTKRRQEAQQRQMLDSLKKGDKVTSIGGICGTVIEAREDEVVVKVDEDTRIRFAKWAIRGVGDAAKAENKQDQKK